MVSDLSGERLKRFLFPCLAVVVALLASDVMVTLLARMSPHLAFQLAPPWSRGGISDPLLGHRLSPYFPGHDRNGYRNEAVPEACYFLAIGDSMTYGYAAKPSGSYPRQLERLTGTAVYNAGIGDYGPCEYEVVIDELLVLNPKVVLLGLYLGNDILDAYKSVYVSRCFPTFANPDQEFKEFLDERKSADTPDDNAMVNPDTKSIFQHSSLYKIARSIRHKLRTRSDAPFRGSVDTDAEISKRPHRLHFQKEPRYRTWFIGPELQARTTDLSDPKIQEGLRITKGRLGAISSRLKETGTKLLVVIIPSKVYVYSPILKQYDQDLFQALSVITNQEDVLKNSLVSYFDGNNIQFIDTTDYLRNVFIANQPPYPPSDDPHPNENGYGAIARAVKDSL